MKQYIFSQFSIFCFYLWNIDRQSCVIISIIMIKSHYGFKMYLYPNIFIPLANWTIYVSRCSKKKVCFLKFKAKKKGGGVNYFCHPQLFKVVRVIVPSSFSHEVVLVKFELQTHMEHLNSCQSGVLVVFGLLNLQFSVLLYS